RHRDLALEGARGRVRGHLHLDRGDAGQLRDLVAALLLERLLHGTRRGGELDVEAHAATVDGEILHEAELDDAAVQVGILDGPEPPERRLRRPRGRRLAEHGFLARLPGRCDASPRTAPRLGAGRLAERTAPRRAHRTPGSARKRSTRTRRKRRSGCFWKV